MLRINKIRFVVALTGLMMSSLWITGIVCAESETGDKHQKAYRVAVVPFKVVKPDEGSATAFCPVCGNAVSAGEVVQDAQRVLEEIFLDRMRERSDVELLSTDRAAGAYQRLSIDARKPGYLQILRQVGKELGADVVAAGFVYRYRERVGYDYSAERPASVAFEIHLISVADGKTIWRGVFDKTQKSLMEDIFQASSFFRGGARWLTARQLTRLGVDETLKTFSGFAP